MAFCFLVIYVLGFIWHFVFFGSVFSLKAGIRVKRSQGFERNSGYIELVL